MSYSGFISFLAGGGGSSLFALILVKTTPQPAEAAECLRFLPQQQQRLSLDRVERPNLDLDLMRRTLHLRPANIRRQTSMQSRARHHRLAMLRLLRRPKIKSRSSQSSKAIDARAKAKGKRKGGASSNDEEEDGEGVEPPSSPQASLRPAQRRAAPCASTALFLLLLSFRIRLRISFVRAFLLIAVIQSNDPTAESLDRNHEEAQAARPQQKAYQTPRLL